MSASFITFGSTNKLYHNSRLTRKVFFFERCTTCLLHFFAHTLYDISFFKHDTSLYVFLVLLFETMWCV